jgi:HSP20 family protein
MAASPGDSARGALKSAAADLSPASKATAAPARRRPPVPKPPSRKERKKMHPTFTASFPGELFPEFDAIQRRIGRLFGLGDPWPSSIRAGAFGAFPAINMGTTQEALEIYAFAPGLDPARIEVSVDKGLLTLAGERSRGLPDGRDIEVYASERFAGAFRRVISLPQDVDTAKVQASYRDGVLKIRVPKLEAALPRRIEVQELERSH